MENGEHHFLYSLLVCLLDPADVGREQRLHPALPVQATVFPVGCTVDMEKRARRNAADASPFGEDRERPVPRRARPLLQAGHQGIQARWVVQLIGQVRTGYRTLEDAQHPREFVLRRRRTVWSKVSLQRGVATP